MPSALLVMCLGYCFCRVLVTCPEHGLFAAQRAAAYAQLSKRLYTLPTAQSAHDTWRQQGPLYAKQSPSHIHKIHSFTHPQGACAASHEGWVSSKRRASVLACVPAGLLCCFVSHAMATSCMYDLCSARKAAAPGCRVMDNLASLTIMLALGRALSLSAAQLVLVMLSAGAL
jgi:hypothetical protein